MSIVVKTKYVIDICDKVNFEVNFTTNCKLCVFLIKHVSVIVTDVYDSSGGILNLKIEFIQIKYHLNLTS